MDSKNSQQILQEFLQNSEQMIQKRRLELQSQYTFDFEEETPINHPRPTFNFTQISSAQIPQFYHIREQVIDLKPIAIDLNKQFVSKDSKVSQEVCETRNSFATQASTFVGGSDRLSTIQNFLDLPSDRMKFSLFNITDRGEETDQTIGLVTSQMITESAYQKDSQITETLNTSSMIEESALDFNNKDQNQSIMRFSKELIVQQFKQRLAVSQQVTPLKNPILPQIKREPIQLEPFSLLKQQSLNNEIEKKLVIYEEEKSEIYNSPKVSNFLNSQKPIIQFQTAKQQKSPKSSQKTPQMVRKVRSNERLNFDQAISSTAQISPQRKLLLQPGDSNKALKSPKNQKLSSTLNTFTTLNVSKTKMASKQVITTDDKRKRITNKKGLQQLLNSSGAAVDTRNIKQIRQANSNQSFTLKKFNNSSQSSIQQIKSFQPQPNKLSPNTDQKLSLHQYNSSQAQIEIQSPALKISTQNIKNILDLTGHQLKDDQSNHSDYFQFGNSADASILDSYNEEGKTQSSTDLISNLRQSQKLYRKQSDQEPESKKLLPNSSNMSVGDTHKKSLATNKVKCSEENLTSIQLKSRNIIKENLVNITPNKKKQLNANNSQQQIQQQILQLSLNKTPAKMNLENL